MARFNTSRPLSCGVHSASRLTELGRVVGDAYQKPPGEITPPQRNRKMVSPHGERPDRANSTPTYILDIPSAAATTSSSLSGFVPILTFTAVKIRSLPHYLVTVRAFGSKTILVENVSNNRTMDSALLATDFGVSAQLFTWASSSAVVWQVMRFVYLMALPLWTAIIVGFAAKPKDLVGRMVVASIAALPFYLLFPAVGPVWVHTDEAMRNCVPSLHFAWVLLLWWYSPKSLRAASALFAALTGVATLALGEHYVIDLVAAIPFTAAVCWASDFSGSRVPRFPLKYFFDIPCACQERAA